MREINTVSLIRHTNMVTREKKSLSTAAGFRIVLSIPGWHLYRSPGRWILWFPCSFSHPYKSWGCRSHRGAETGRSTSSWTPAMHSNPEQVRETDNSWQQKYDTMTWDFKLMCCLANVVKIPEWRADTVDTASYTAVSFSTSLLLPLSQLWRCVPVIKFQIS